MVWSRLVLVLVAGCGRIGFDARATATGDDDTPSPDGPPASLAALECPSAASTALCTGLVALLHFDKDPARGETAMLAHDFSGLGNHATCTPPNCPTWVAAGRFGGAFAFTDPDAFAIANAPSLSLSSVTMSAWFYPNTLATNWRIIITKIQASPLVANYGIPHNGTQLCVNYATASAGWQNYCVANSYTPGRWYHIVGVLDGASHTATLYVDGVQVLSQPAAMPLDPDTGDVWIGWSPTNFGVDGLIDEVAIWNRTLSASEIAALY